MADVIDKDLGWGEFVRGYERLALATAIGIEVGIFDPDVDEYMAVHEFGSTSHRARAWMRGVIDANKKRYEQLEDKALEAILRGEDPERALAPLATTLVRDLKASIRQHDLIDTGRAIRSVEARPARQGGSS